MYDQALKKEIRYTVKNVRYVVLYGTETEKKNDMMMISLNIDEVVRKIPKGDDKGGP